MGAPTDVGRPVVTAAAWRQSLPFAYTCRAAYRLWASCLQYADLSAAAASLTDTHLCAVVHTARHAPLHRLCARRCAGLTAHGIAQTLTPMFAQLRSLDLSYTRVDDDAMAALFGSVVTDCGSKALAGECRETQGHEHKQEEEEEGKPLLGSRAGSRAGSYLSSLVVNGCVALTPRSLATVAACRPPLRFLDVGGLDDAVMDSSLDMLLGAVGGTLRTLIVSHCRRVSDVGLRIVGTRCPGLVSITLRGLPLVTDNGLRELCVRVGHRLVILDALDCTGLTLGGYMAIIRTWCPHIYRHICRPTNNNNDNSNIATSTATDDGAAPASAPASIVVNRTLRDCITATMPGLIYRISATDAIRRLPALYFLLLDESALRPFRVAVQGRSLNLSDFGTVLVSNFGTKPTSETRAVLRERLGHDSAFEADSDDEPCPDGPQRSAA